MPAESEGSLRKEFLSPSTKPPSFILSKPPANLAIVFDSVLTTSPSITALSF